MKTKLSSLFLLLTIIGYSQVDIEQFQSANGSMYSVLDNTVIIDETPSGTSPTWDFTGLAKTGNSSDVTRGPIGSETTDFPGTTLVSVVTVDASAANSIYLKEVSGAGSTNDVSITGLIAPGLILKYSTNDALIGNFPLLGTSLGTNVVDAVEGDFEYDDGANDGTGTFTGNATSGIDANGTLNIKGIGDATFTYNVTRLKIVQDLIMNGTFNLESFPGFTVTINDAAVTQTSYYYYDNATNNLIFRSNNILIPPIGGASENQVTYESLQSSTTLSDVNFSANAELRIKTNPVTDVLIFSLSNELNIKAITILDISGRTILEKKTSRSILNVETLTSGMYIASIETNKGIVSKKFLKQ